MEGSKGTKMNLKISHCWYSPIIFFSCLSCTCWSFFWRDSEINALLLPRIAQKFPHRKEKDYWAWIERSACSHYGWWEPTAQVVVIWSANNGCFQGQFKYLYTALSLAKPAWHRLIMLKYSCKIVVGNKVVSVLLHLLVRFRWTLV